MDPQASLAELVRTIDRAVPPGADHVRRGGVWAWRAARPTEPGHAMYMPMLCVMAQGAKRLQLGDETLVYDAGKCLLNSAALPAAGWVAEASPERPCLWTMIELDAVLVAEVDAQVGPSRPGPPLPAMETGPLDGPTLDAVLRLVRLFEAPDDAPFFAPMLLREIVYRLLSGAHAPRLRQIVSLAEGRESVARAIEWLRLHYRRPMRVEALAREAGLSPSALHRHFKRVTAMTPLEFQRQMRLQEAKRLMVAEGLDAAGAGVRVGYDDASYFSRDYRRFFGDPPRRHVARTRQAVAAAP